MHVLASLSDVVVTVTYICQMLAIKTPGGKRILFKNIIAQQIIRKRHMQREMWQCDALFMFIAQHEVYTWILWGY
jgi:hypothetical protein